MAFASRADAERSIGRKQHLFAVERGYTVDACATARYQATCFTFGGREAEADQGVDQRRPRRGRHEARQVLSASALGKGGVRGFSGGSGGFGAVREHGGGGGERGFGGVDLGTLERLQSRDLCQGQVGEQFEETADVGVVGVSPELPVVVRREHLSVEPHRPGCSLAHFGAVGGGDERRGQSEGFSAVDAADEVGAVDDVPPLVRTAHLEADIVAAAEFEEVVGLEDHVVEFEEAERLFAVEAEADAIEGEHAVDAEMAADVAQEGDVGESFEPISVVDLDWGFHETGENAGDRLFVISNCFGREELAGVVLAAGIPDLAGAAAKQDYGAVAGLFEAAQQHDADQIADVERGRGEIKADIGGERTGGGERVEALDVGALVDVAARLQHFEEFGSHGAAVAGAAALRNWLAVGLMSGTSMDGVDAALVETDGGARIRPLGFVFRAYDDALRARLADVMAYARGVKGPVATDAVRAVERELTDAHGAAVDALLAETGARPEVVGFHGQTIVHRPDAGWTWQIGDGPALAARLGVPVIYNFRRADMANGGQGAPLLPVFHRALADKAREGDAPVGVLNLGGVGNLTWLGQGLGAWSSFDTGPGNALIDDWARLHTGAACDAGGRLAAAGRVDALVLATLLDHPYFEAPPPKSLDRAAFSIAPVAGLSAEDGAATLTAFTAATVARALAHVPVAPSRLLVCGGGRHNPVLMAAIGDATGLRAVPVEAVGWDGDALEAQAFAYFAVRRMTGRAVTFPETTGCKEPTVGGVVAEPA